jgi:hypothetical protein
MENNPPPSVSLMHSRPHSKSSPAKRDATRVLTPHLNQLAPPSDDVFQTGLLTPHASQNAVEIEAAKSLISPPPEGNAQAGSSRQHVCFTSEFDFALENSGLTFLNTNSRAGAELVRNPPLVRAELQTLAVYLNANAPRSHHRVYKILVE